MKAFYEATLQLGVALQVTTFTLSDFSRTWVLMATSVLITRGARTSSSWAVRCSAVNFTVCLVLTERFFRRLRLMGRTIPTRGVTQGAAGYQPSP
jgi:hypothetical protein